MHTLHMFTFRAYFLLRVQFSSFSVFFLFVGTCDLKQINMLCYMLYYVVYRGLVVFIQLCRVAQLQSVA